MTGGRERWTRRVLVAAALAAVVVVATTALELDPEPVRVVLLCALVVVGAELLTDGLPSQHEAWYPTPAHVPIDRGRDQVTQGHLRHLENHLAARHPDPALRDRIAVVADAVLVARHGVRLDSERGRELLGPELVDVLEGPVVRLTAHRVDALVSLIEEL